MKDYNEMRKKKEILLAKQGVFPQIILLFWKSIHRIGRTYHITDFPFY